MLHLPDPKVDILETGVGAVLSQHHCEPPKLIMCTFFFRELSSAEQNYYVGNCKLLAVQLAMEERRHWLEGAQFLISVITDYKNLQYIHATKCLNPRQARWALFSLI